MAPDLCPCTSGLARSACCGPYLDGHAEPPTALALMRSRYTAHVEARPDYLRRTTAPEAKIRYHSVVQWSELAHWQGLTILESTDGGRDDDHGEVTFEFRFNAEGRDNVRRERSQFRRENGRWVYVSGVDPRKDERTVRRARPRVGRNEPCYCGSGLKYKRCCGKNDRR